MEAESIAAQGGVPWTSIASFGLQLGPEIFRLVQGIKQTKEGKRLAAGLKDPIYDIPDSAEESLARARQMTASRYMSGQTNLQNQLDQNTANVTSDIMRSATSSADVLGALSAVNAQNQMGQQQIGFQAAQNYDQRVNDFRGALDMMARFEDKKWTNDVLNKFLRDSAAASALRNAGIQNTYGAVKGMANTGSAFLSTLPSKSGEEDGGQVVNQSLSSSNYRYTNPNSIPYWMLQEDNLSFANYLPSGFIKPE